MATALKCTATIGKGDAMTAAPSEGEVRQSEDCIGKAGYAMAKLGSSCKGRETQRLQRNAKAESSVDWPSYGKVLKSIGIVSIVPTCKGNE